ncbi:hypothetical protein WN51_00247 [Melipona quadrifasciata]|uniref:Uncharacterized protein n=1 Tax=Melipona quadrifasciata TaxID=166423 RepID=A0A0N0U584_9HYME|nr:hypothetical protein WN51_00247 [Melipona quadrifasciata]
MLMLHMIITNGTRLSVSQSKPTFIMKSLSNIIKMNYNASGLVSVVLFGMFKYLR